MSRAIITCWHCYTPDYGQEYYAPILDFYLTKMRRFKDEYDRLYIIDSNWNVGPDKLTDMKASVIKVNPSLRYFDAYKEVLPQIKEDIVLFLDNDFIIYRAGVLKEFFKKVSELQIDVVASIYDTIGQMTYSRLNDKSKFCLYCMAGRTEMFKRFLDVDWAPNMPEYETLGLLTSKILNHREIVPVEIEEDKNSIYFDGVQDGEKSKDLGYYHIGAGTTPAVLLAWKDHSPDTYWEYLKNQPKREYLRQMAWFNIMLGMIFPTTIIPEVQDLLTDAGVTQQEWADYLVKFIKYHGLEEL